MNALAQDEPKPDDIAGRTADTVRTSAGMFGADAADRLLLDLSREARRDLGDGALAVVNDLTGALSLQSAAEGAREVLVHQDSLVAERRLDRRAEQSGLAGILRRFSFTTDAKLPAGVVLLRLPRSLDHLDDLAAAIASTAGSGAVVYAGGRTKHMTPAMNEVLRRSFAHIDVSHARQKSRVLIAREPLPVAPRRAAQAEVDVPGLAGPIRVHAYGGAFAGAAIDIGTRFLLEQLSRTTLPVRQPDDAYDMVDLACGTGVIGTWFALRDPTARVCASDVSTAAVRSAAQTAHANGVDIDVHRDDGLARLPSTSVSLVVLNPPFHDGPALSTEIALGLFRDAARVLRPGGSLWTVWNTHLRYRSALERLVGPTEQIARNPRFTITRSVRGNPA